MPTVLQSLQVMLTPLGMVQVDVVSAFCNSILRRMPTAHGAYSNRPCIYHKDQWHAVHVLVLGAWQCALKPALWQRASALK